MKANGPHHSGAEKGSNLTTKDYEGSRRQELLLRIDFVL
jgi:hypothetical protein